MTTKIQATLLDRPSVRVELWTCEECEGRTVLTFRYHSETLDERDFAVAESIISARTGQADSEPEHTYEISEGWCVLCWTLPASSGIVT